MIKEIALLITFTGTGGEYIETYVPMPTMDVCREFAKRTESTLVFRPTDPSTTPTGRIQCIIRALRPGDNTFINEERE